MQVCITIKDTTPFKVSEPILLEAQCDIHEIGPKFRKVAKEHPAWRIEAVEKGTRRVVFRAWRNSKGTLHIEMPEYGLCKEEPNE